jgi:hypothetical protein
MRREKAAPPHAVLPIDPHGNWIWRSEGFYIEWTRIDAVEQYLEYRKSGVVPQKQAAFDTVERIVHALLAQVVAGEDPAEVFQVKKPRKQRGRRRHVNSGAMCAEVLRLQILHGVDPVMAKDEVARVFEVDVRTVERAVKKLANTSMYSEQDILNYEHNLRVRHVLK